MLIHIMEIIKKIMDLHTSTRGPCGSTVVFEANDLFGAKMYFVYVLNYCERLLGNNNVTNSAVKLSTFRIQYKRCRNFVSP